LVETLPPGALLPDAAPVKLSPLYATWGMARAESFALAGDA